MGAQWLNACGQVDAETTGARWAAVHGCPWPTAAEIGYVFLRKIKGPDTPTCQLLPTSS